MKSIKQKKSRNWIVVSMILHTKPGAHKVRKRNDKRLARGKVNIKKEGW